MSAFAPSIGLGDTVLAANAANYLADIGNEYLVGSIKVRFVKATSADTAPARKVKVATVTAGRRTGAVDSTTTANDVNVSGVCLNNQAAFAAGDLFLIQTGGQFEGLSSDTVAVAGDPLGTGSLASLGQLQGVATATTLVSLLDVKVMAKRIGYLLKVATAANATVVGFIDRPL